MSEYLVKFKNAIFGTPAPVPTPIVEKPIYVYTPTLWDSIFTSSAAAAVEKKLAPANDVIAKTGGIVGTIGSINLGLKYGITAALVIFALYLVVEFKMLSRGLKG